MHVTQLITAHRWSVRTEECSAQSLWTIPKLCSAEASVDHGGAAAWRSKHGGVLNIDNTRPESSQSLQEGRGWGAPSFSSTPSSLKFTARLLAEDTWQAFARANSQPRTTSRCRLSRGADSCSLRVQNQDSWGRADLRMQTFLSVHWRCRCWVGNLLKPEHRWDGGVTWPAVRLLINPFVRLPQISPTWSPNWAPPFLPRNWWPD